MARKIFVDQLIIAQKKRLAAGIQTIDAGLEDVRNAARKDLMDLTNGTPTGKERRKWLKQNGHPFGKGISAAASTPTGAKRNVPGRKRVKNLPIGIISGSLRRRIISRRQGNKLIIGFGAGQSNWVILPGGTKKMVDRKMMGPNGAVRERVRSRLYALRSHWKKANRTP
jgi:hypothetical protein